MVTDLTEGTSRLSVTLDDGVRILELGKVGV